MWRYALRNLGPETKKIAMKPAHVRSSERAISQLSLVDLWHYVLLEERKTQQRFNGQMDVDV